jgi:NAD(P)-dependent dehydrogenase (short-subunit alcohol dehydrogenase family)
MRGTTGKNVAAAAEVARDAAEHGVALRTVELDVSSSASVDAAIAKIIADNGRLDVVIHNAGHMSFGPAEAFTPDQLAELYDVNVLSTQRVNRAALPQLRKEGRGLLVWVSSTSVRGGTPPYLSPYFAAKAAMDSLAVSYASELTRWGVETSIIVSRPSSRPTLTPPRSPPPSWTSSESPSASDRSGPISIPPRTAARSSTVSPTG